MDCNRCASSHCMTQQTVLRQDLLASQMPEDACLVQHLKLRLNGSSADQCSSKHITMHEVCVGSSQTACRWAFKQQQGNMDGMQRVRAATWHAIRCGILLADDEGGPERPALDLRPDRLAQASTGCACPWTCTTTEISASGVPVKQLYSL